MIILHQVITAILTIQVMTAILTPELIEFVRQFKQQRTLHGAAQKKYKESKPDFIKRNNNDIIKMEK